MSVALVDRDDGIAADVGPQHPGVGDGRSGDDDGRDRRRHLGVARVRTPPQEAHASALAPAVDFTRDEVIEICGALAPAGTLLRRLGLAPEAARLEALFIAVQQRLAEHGIGPLVEAQPATGPSVFGSAAPSLSGS